MRFRCSICHYSYKSADAFSDHVKKVHVKSMVMCSECHSVFDNAERLQWHASEVHKSIQVKILEFFVKQYVLNLMHISNGLKKNLFYQ